MYLQLSVDCGLIKMKKTKLFPLICLQFNVGAKLCGVRNLYAQGALGEEKRAQCGQRLRKDLVGGRRSKPGVNVACAMAVAVICSHHAIRFIRTHVQSVTNC